MFTVGSHNSLYKQPRTEVLFKKIDCSMFLLSVSTIKKGLFSIVLTNQCKQSITIVYDRLFKFWSNLRLKFSQLFLIYRTYK